MPRPPGPTLFPYTTLFRSPQACQRAARAAIAQLTGETQRRGRVAERRVRADEAVGVIDARFGDAERLPPDQVLLPHLELRLRTARARDAEEGEHGDDEQDEDQCHAVLPSQSAGVQLRREGIHWQPPGVSWRAGPSSVAFPNTSRLADGDRKSTRLNSSHTVISYA